MSGKVYSDTHFTAQVKVIINKLYGKSIVKDSLLERAMAYYESQPLNQNKLDTLKTRIVELKSLPGDEKIKKQLAKAEREYREIKQELKDESNERHQFLLNICREIVELTEGNNFNECNRKSAQMLGTIQLLNPTQGKKVAEANEKSKPLYRAILCLRLLDKLCIDEAFIAHDGHLKQYLHNIDGDNYQNWPKVDAQSYQAFVDNVKIPLVMAALLQDIGNFHQDALKILTGDDGKLDVHRTLPVDERKSLLQVNYRETINFLVEGIGAALYVGNSKTERDKFNLLEHSKLVFIKHLLKNAISPKQGIGNLLKVPQIYTSIILSTKPSYNYKLLPKVYQALDQNAERGTCSQYVVDTLHEITGDFPQGFGVTYIPRDRDGKEGEQYEYAIVNQLYPNTLDHPLCRTATRNLTFIGHGQDIEVPLSVNLYHTDTAKAFSSISKERLNEILEKLSSNYQERKKLDLLPRCWDASEFFSMKSHQKLWNKTSR
ncbi:hypothetical protein [Thalassotalea sp. G2M2-11]|uniref:hypothetical protein n=1 Tax=Thalassotalea sp. G2M2-11 TaxID=2787627 RepID=UPI0019D319C3|nr:hypothetical protein [Thalassotalea sp. G2M2-11]